LKVLVPFSSPIFKSQNRLEGNHHYPPPTPADSQTNKIEIMNIYYVFELSSPLPLPKPMGQEMQAMQFIPCLHTVFAIEIGRQYFTCSFIKDEEHSIDLFREY